MSGRGGAMFVIAGFAGLLLIIAIFSGWQGTTRLTSRGDDTKAVEEASQAFVEAYGTFDFREPEAYRRRLLAVTSGAVDEALRPTLFSNIDGLTVFQVSAQDARYLAPELGGDLDVPDLTSLDDFKCYARWWADGRRLPAFSLRLDPPPSTDARCLHAIVDRSAERYGRPREQVAREIEERVVQHNPAKPPRGQGGSTEEAKGEPADDLSATPASGEIAPGVGDQSPSQKQPSQRRNHNRDRRKQS